MDDILLDLLHMEMVALFQPHNADAPIKQLDLSKLEQMGFSTGCRFAERLTINWQRFKDELDVMKFICKEYWVALFNKQMDNLRTNHQGVYVLLDNKFRFVAQISRSKQHIDWLAAYLPFTCGLIRGALSSFGITAVVSAEMLLSPCVRFQVQVHRNTPHNN